MCVCAHFCAHITIFSHLHLLPGRLPGLIQGIDRMLVVVSGQHTGNGAQARSTGHVVHSLSCSIMETVYICLYII